MAVIRREASRPAPQAAATAEDGPKPAFLEREEASQTPGKKVGEAVAGTRLALRQTPSPRPAMGGSSR